MLTEGLRKLQTTRRRVKDRNRIKDLHILNQETAVHIMDNNINGSSNILQATTAKLFINVIITFNE